MRLSVEEDRRRGAPVPAQRAVALATPGLSDQFDVTSFSTSLQGGRANGTTNLGQQSIRGCAPEVKHLSGNSDLLSSCLDERGLRG